MINFKKFNSIISLTAYFNSDDKCKQAITEARWGVGNNQDVVCPYCGKHHCKMSKNGRYHCTECNKNFLVSLAQSSRIPSCHLSSGSLECTLSLLTRRVYHHTNLQETLRLLSQQPGICFRRFVFSTLRLMLMSLRVL